MRMPCKKDCPDRKAGCHNKDCPHGWYEWNEAHIRLREEIYRNNNLRHRIPKPRFDNFKK